MRVKILEPFFIVKYIFALKIRKGFFYIQLICVNKGYQKKSEFFRREHYFVFIHIEKTLSYGRISEQGKYITFCN